MTSHRPDPVTRLANLLWVSGPIRIQRRFAGAVGVVGDWYGLALVPPLAVAVMVAVPVAYFLIGATTLGYVDLYSEWLGLLMSFAVLGALSGQLGVLAVLAFAVGDFIFGHPVWTLSGYPFTNETIVEQVIRTRMPLIISYLLLLIPALAVPRLGKILVLRTGRARRLPPQLAWVLATPVTLVVAWIGVRSWVAAAPTLLRPYFFWVGAQPTVEAIVNLQEHGQALVGPAVAATLARQLLLGAFVYIPALSRRLDLLAARAFQGVGSVPRGASKRGGSKLRIVLVDVASSFASALVLAGIVESLPMWLLIFGAFLLVRLVRSRVIRVRRLERWRIAVARVPAPLRLVGLWLVASVAAQSALIGSYSSMAWVVFGGVFLLFLLFPGEPEVESVGRPRNAAPTKEGGR